jgi:hypothetical protein
MASKRSRAGTGAEVLEKERRELQAAIESAASAIESADVLVITAGGRGVDSALPD